MSTQERRYSVSLLGRSLLHRATAHERRCPARHLVHPLQAMEGAWSFDVLLPHVVEKLDVAGAAHGLPERLDKVTCNLVTCQGSALIRAQHLRNVWGSAEA
jgi:hypothetical protein